MAGRSKLDKARMRNNSHQNVSLICVVTNDRRTEPVCARDV